MFRGSSKNFRHVEQNTISCPNTELVPLCTLDIGRVHFCLHYLYTQVDGIVVEGFIHLTWKFFIKMH